MNKVVIHIEGQDRLSPLLRELARSNEHLIQTARLSGDVLSDMAESLGENSEALRQTIPDTQKMAEAARVASDAYLVQSDSIRESAQTALRAAEAGRKAAQNQIDQARSLSEQIPELLGKVIEASEEFRRRNLIAEAAKKGFNKFRKETADGLQDLFSVVFKGETEKFKGTWQAFTTKLGDDFLRMLSRIAAGMTQELLLKPALELGEQALAGLGPALKSLFLAEGGLVTKPTLAVLGEAGPEVVLPLKA